MSGFVPKKVSNARMRTKTNQTGLKMSGTATMLGRRGYIQRYVNRRVQPNVGVCGYPHGYRCINGVEPIFDSTGALLNPEAVRQNCKLVVNGINGINCVDAAPKNQGLAGGVGRINAPRFGCNISCSTGLPNPYSRKSKIPVENVFFYPNDYDDIRRNWITTNGYSQREWRLLFFVDGRGLASFTEDKFILSYNSNDMNSQDKKYFSIEKPSDDYPKVIMKQKTGPFPAATTSIKGSFKVSVTYKPYDEHADEQPKTKIFTFNYLIKNEPVQSQAVFPLMYTNSGSVQSQTLLQKFFTAAYDPNYYNQDPNYWNNQNLAIAPKITDPAGGGNSFASQMLVQATALSTSGKFSSVEKWFRPTGSKNGDLPDFDFSNTSFITNLTNALVTSGYVTTLNDLTGVATGIEYNDPMAGGGPAPYPGLSGSGAWQNNVIYAGGASHYKLSGYYNNVKISAPQLYEQNVSGLNTGNGVGAPCDYNSSQYNLWVSPFRAFQNKGWPIKISKEGDTTIAQLLINIPNPQDSGDNFRKYIDRTMHIYMNTIIKSANNNLATSFMPVFAFGNNNNPSTADVAFDVKGAMYVLWKFDQLCQTLYTDLLDKIKYVGIYNVASSDQSSNYGSYLTKSPCNACTDNKKKTPPYCNDASATRNWWNTYGQ